jgi:hypothetical protein
MRPSTSEFQISARSTPSFGGLDAATLWVSPSLPVSQKLTDNQNYDLLTPDDDQYIATDKRYFA